MGEWVAGVDLGGTKIEFGLVDPQNRIVSRLRVPTEQHEGPQAVVECIAQSVAQLESVLPDGQRIAALGLCSPGPLDHHTGTLMDPPNLPGLHHAPLGQMLAERLDLPVVLEHDAKATALGVFHYGVGRGHSASSHRRSMVYIVVGTGVGAAIIVDGRLYRGEHNFAGEVGHITLDRNGEACHCGSRGCVETYLSGPALARRYQQALDRLGEERPLGDQKPITGKRIAQLAGQGDALAGAVMAEAGEALGTMVASLAMILGIDLYVVGGSVAKAGELLLGPARRTVPRYSFRSVSSKVHIVATELGDAGPILGCSWLARQILSKD